MSADQRHGIYMRAALNAAGHRSRPPEPPPAAYDDGYGGDDDDGQPDYRFFTYKLPDVPAIVSVIVTEPMDERDAEGAAYLATEAFAEEILRGLKGTT